MLRCHTSTQGGRDPWERVQIQKRQIQKGHAVFINIQKGHIQTGQIQKGHTVFRHIQKGHIQTGRIQMGHTAFRNIQKGHILTRRPGFVDYQKVYMT
jgi:hypothetical protein